MAEGSCPEVSEIQKQKLWFCDRELGVLGLGFREEAITW